MRNLLATTLAMVMIQACAPGAAEDPGTDPAPAAAESRRPGPSMLPAWPGPNDRHRAGKADQYSDYRAQYPEFYAITEPPAPAFRSFLEWEPMQAVLLAYTGDLGTAVTNSMVRMVVHGADAVDWWVLVPDATRKNEFVNRAKSLGLPQSTIDAKVHFLTYQNDSIWMIDFGPFPLVKDDGAVAFTDMRYYHERVVDDAVPTWLGNQWGLTTYRAPLSLEGGNFNADGTGTCYTTQGAFWENADKTEAQVRDAFRQYLGCSQMVTLIPLEDGTTHIDMFSKLVGPNTFLLGKGSSSQNTTKTINDLETDAGILQAVVRADGSKLTVHRIPMPYQKDGVWRTFTNSTLANGVNLWPIYPDYATLQAEALAAWQQALPSWQHVGIDSDEIITWGGAMHCISRNVPAGTLAKWVPDGTCNRGTCDGGAGAQAGTCQVDADCAGPRWLCPLNDCSGSGGCGDLTDVGCCDGSLLRYCEGNVAKSMDCSGTAGCGWNLFGGYYDCGYTGTSGTYPKACSTACVPSCAGRECGPDGCGGTCGTCPAGKACGVQGLCEAGGATYPEACLGEDQPSAADCAVVDSFAGCCDAKGRAVWCDGGRLYCLDCAAEAAPGNTCGWAAEIEGQPANFYACGLTGSDPTGANPRACDTTCTPACQGRQCGADGCGGTCGSCPQGQDCDRDGQCVSTVPDPGPDAVEDPGPATDVPPVDAGGGDAPPADAAGTDTASPDVAGPDTAPPDGACLPRCEAGRCGDDGCGGRCPECAAGYTCNAASWCVRDADARVDAGGDASGGDTGIAPLPAKGGGCSAGAGPASGSAPAWFWLGIVALLAIRLVYTTARE